MRCSRRCAFFASFGVILVWSCLTLRFELESPERDANASDFVLLGMHVAEPQLSLLDETIARWPGNMVVVVMTNRSDVQLQPEGRVSTLLYSPKNKEMYPVNALRQKALEACRAEFYFALDSDFVPSADLYATLSSLRSLMLSKGREYVFVIPGFEVDQESPMLPRNKRELGECMLRSYCRAVRLTQWKYGHMDTNFSQWWLADKPYEIQSTTLDFEPYIVGKRSCLPPYDLSFSSWGRDKVQWIMHIKQWGARFLVIPNGFVIHRNHEPYMWAKRRPSQEFLATRFEAFKRNIATSEPPPQCFSKLHAAMWIDDKGEQKYLDF